MQNFFKSLALESPKDVTIINENHVISAFSTSFSTRRHINYSHLITPLS